MNDLTGWEQLDNIDNPFDDPFETDPMDEAAPAVEESTTQPEVTVAATPAAAKEELAQEQSTVPASAASEPAPPAEDPKVAEARKRAEHEAAEAKRKAEWEARQQQKKAARQAELDRIAAMTEDELLQAAMDKAGKDTEKLTRRNMKECVLEYVQTLCLADPAFARLTLTPPKSMIRCFQYINHKAWEYVQDELKASDQQLGRDNPVYGCDVPDDLCYTWAEEYFRDPNAKEDEDQEEKFVPKPYPGASSTKSKPKASTKKKPVVKPAEKKPPEKEQAKKPEETSCQLSLGDFAA